jgi:hypothetical protein
MGRVKLMLIASTQTAFTPVVTDAIAVSEAAS